MDSLRLVSPRRSQATFASLLALTLLVAGPPPAAAKSKAKPTGPGILVTEALGHPHIGEPAPDFELTDQNGQTVRLSALRGSVVVVALVASWCPYSQAEQKNLVALATDTAPRGVRTLGVVVADNEKGYKKYLGRMAMPFPVLRDADDRVALAYAPQHAQPSFKDRRKVPVTANLVIDREGVIRHFALIDTAHFDAELTAVRAEVDRLLAAAP
ncbi:MAG: redoxin domain-containing protein [Thermoanaerobaculia bacterium]